MIEAMLEIRAFLGNRKSANELPDSRRLADGWVRCRSIS